MRGIPVRILLAGMAIVCAASAQAFQFSVLSVGTFDTTTGIDTEAVQFSYYNGIAPINVTTFVLDANTNTGYLAGPGNVDRLNFQISGDTLQTLNGSQNIDLNWQYTSGSGAFANLTGIGSISLDAHYVDGITYQTTSGMTGELEPVPEPASLAILGLGGLALLRRRKA